MEKFELLSVFSTLSLQFAMQTMVVFELFRFLFQFGASKLKVLDCCARNKFFSTFLLRNSCTLFILQHASSIHFYYTFRFKKRLSFSGFALLVSAVVSGSFSLVWRFDLAFLVSTGSTGSLNIVLILA